MDMRLGKWMVGTRSCVNRGYKCVLIVTPYSAIPDGCQDMTDDGLTWVCMYGSSPEQAEAAGFAQGILDSGRLTGPMFCVINPEGLFEPTGRSGEKNPSPKPCVTLMEYDAIIWDESTNLRNPKSQINYAANNFFGSVENRIGLSGEYRPESDQDVFEQMKFIFGSFMGCKNYWKWQTENFQKVDYDWVPRKGMAQEIRRVLNERCFILSRKAAGIKIPASRKRLVVQMPDKIRKAYQHVEKYFEIPAWVDPNTKTKFAVSQDQWKHQIAGGYPKDFPSLYSDHKMKALMGLLEEYKGEPVVVLFRYTNEVVQASRQVTEKKIKHGILWGLIPPGERVPVLRSFQTGQLDLLLCQAKSVRHGMNLSRARTMIRYSMPADNLTYGQTAERIVDVVKTDPILYVDIVTEDTCDEDQYYALGDKQLDSRLYMTRIEQNRLNRMARLYGGKSAAKPAH